MLKFVEGSKRGTVLMSLGTNVKSNMLGNERLTSILKTFASLPEYNFIWKFESEVKDLPIKPTKNVFISKFLPQNDILAHPRVKAFVTHAGLLSSQEAKWYGKPMIGIPFFCDQKQCIRKSVRLGIAVEIDFRELSVEILRTAISTVLEDPKYSENAKKISKIFQDIPEKPLDKAVWWIEYVIRNPNAPQFSPTSLKIGYIAANSYDVFLTFIVVILVFIFLVFKGYSFLKANLTKSSKKVKSN